MKAIVSKVMAKTLNNALNTIDMKIEYHEMSYEAYSTFVSYDTLEHTNDWNFEKSVFKVLRIIYPEEYYAMPQYATTNDLQRILRNTSKNTLEEFVNEFYKEYQV